MTTLNISSFIWGIADDVLRDVYVRGKYRDVILPMTVIRRLDAVLEPTKDAVVRMKEQLDAAGITNAFLCFEETEQSKIFPNEAFGYWKVTVERPLRLEDTDPERAYTAKEIKALKDDGKRSEAAPPVIKKPHEGVEADPLRGLFPATIKGKPAVVQYEPDTDLRDTEQVPLLEKGGIDAFLRREVLPYAPDAWYVPSSVKTGYEISFARCFYKPQPLRPLEDIRADILAPERETEGLLAEIVG